MYEALKRYTASLLVCGASFSASAQSETSVSLLVSDGNAPLPAVTVELLSGKDSALVKIGVTDATGKVAFSSLPERNYFFRATHSGYAIGRTAPFTPVVERPVQLELKLQPVAGTLANVTVTARKPFLEQKPGKTVVNLENSITAVGSTVAEALERLPNVSMDQNGNIALKGRQGVNVFIDGKPSNLSGTELATLLQGMSAANIAQIELMDQPPARYEASGGAGIINIITKKNRARGFNGSLSTAFSMGRYPKANSSFQLALRQGKWSINATYSVNVSRNYLEIDALRTYFRPDGSVKALLDQPSGTKNFGSTNNLRTSADYALSQKTTLVFSGNALWLDRENKSLNEANWKNPAGALDSALTTQGRTAVEWRNGGAGLGLRHSFSASRQLSIDLDGQWYRTHGRQYFENSALQPVPYTEAYRSDAPGELRILTARADYSIRTKNWNWETGGRLADINTDNEVIYEANEGAGWHPDMGRSNHFVYHERIGALYGSGEWKGGKWTINGGLRFEATAYDARQLGNAQVKDSSFSRDYASLFPSLLLSFEADSNSTWTLSTGRRIDRPPFQKLNPFSFFINKYTVQRGNPFFKPQYSWNAELTHTWKSWLTTGIGYSITTDYFAQLFPVDPNGLVVYTEGNLGQLQVISLTVGVQRAPTKWWNLNANLLLQRKIQEGFVEQAYSVNIDQATFNMTNTFRFGGGWSGEVGGQYTSRSQVDIQEVLDPSGQLSVGVAKTVLKGAGTIKLAGRDLFHTQWIKGNTVFRGVHEWFRLSRDTRVAVLSFSWRFGKAFKQVRRNVVNEEAQRASAN
jgi:iron complex outermembrane recepter protein